MKLLPYLNGSDVGRRTKPKVNATKYSWISPTPIQKNNSRTPLYFLFSSKIQLCNFMLKYLIQYHTLHLQFPKQLKCFIRYTLGGITHIIAFQKISYSFGYFVEQLTSKIHAQTFHKCMKINELCRNKLHSSQLASTNLCTSHQSVYLISHPKSWELLDKSD